jgi:hypothetical protein
MFMSSLAMLKEYCFRTSFPFGLAVCYLTVMLNSAQSDNTVYVINKFDHLCGSGANKNILLALWSLQGIPK